MIPHRYSTQSEPSTADAILIVGIVLCVVAMFAVTLLSIATCYDCTVHRTCQIK